MCSVSTHRIEARGPATVQEAWARYEDPCRWPEWAPHIRSVDADGPRLRPGLMGRVRVVGGVRASFVVETVDTDHHTWTWRVSCGPIRLHLAHDLSPAGVGCRAGLTTTGPRAVVLPYLPLAAWALRRLVATQGRQTRDVA